LFEGGEVRPPHERLRRALVAGFVGVSEGKALKAYELQTCISAETIRKRVDEVAARIDRDYAGREIVLVGILKGAFVFMADLIRRLSVPAEVEFVRVASYGGASESSGRVCLTKDVEMSVEGRDVLLVEDIVDSGRTLDWLLDHFAAKGASSVRICALLDKRERRETDLQLDYVAIEVEKGFLVGYGLDFAEKHRNLPDIQEVRFVDEAGG
jgi:hypoxanthine phosphoribosyltransferase